MSIKIFFQIVIKILGLIILLFDPYRVVENLFSEIFRPDREGYIIAFLLLSLLAIFSLSYYLIIRTNLIISFLNLDKGFDENINMKNININKLLAISLFIVGGILIVYSFSPLLVALIYSFSGSINEDIKLSTPQDINYSLIICVVDLILGILLITNAKRIALHWSKKINDLE